MPDQGLSVRGGVFAPDGLITRTQVRAPRATLSVSDGQVALVPTAGNDLGRAGIGRGVSPSILEVAPFHRNGMFYLGLRIKGRTEWTWFFQRGTPASELADVLEVAGAIRRPDARLSLADRLPVSFLGSVLVAVFGIALIALSVTFRPAIDATPLPPARPPDTMSMIVLFLGVCCVAAGLVTAAIHTRAAHTSSR